jgi:hypothetical protein
VRFEVVERRGYRGYKTAEPDLKAYLAARELWQTRRRGWGNDLEGMQHGLERIRQMVDLVGQDLACHLVFEESVATGKSATVPGPSRSAGRIR